MLYTLNVEQILMNVALYPESVQTDNVSTAKVHIDVNVSLAIGPVKTRNGV
jgi:hypothetical protein